MESTTGVFGNNGFVWEYGKRGDKRLELFPLSMADQLKLTKLIAGLFGKVAEMNAQDTGAGNVEFLALLADLLGDNIETIVALVADLPKDDSAVIDIKNHMTNEQLMSFVTYVWETNYGSVRKNYSSLFNELGTMKKGLEV